MSALTAPILMPSVVTQSPLLGPLRWLLRRRIEVLVFAFGVLLRLSRVWNHDPAWGYDFSGHWELIEWILKHRTVPSAESTFESYHPPLYYLTAAWLVTLGATRATLVWFSVSCGVLRLGLIWVGLELYVRHSRWGRVAALGLASVTDLLQTMLERLSF